MSSFNTIDEALKDLKEGKMIVVVDDEDRENEGDLVALAEYASKEVVNFMITHAKGLLCVPVSEKIKDKLGLETMVKNNLDPKKTAFTYSIDHISCETGISAKERSNSIKAIINDNAKRSDFTMPGHIFPLIAKDGGVLERPGHTEAAVDLAKMCGSKEAGVICEIIKEDGSMARLDDLDEYTKKHNLKMISIEDLIKYRLEREIKVIKVSEANLPTEYGEFKMIGYFDELTKKEHIVLVKGEIEENIKVRIHSECLTGDVFGSKRCDCGPQLSEALKEIEKEGKGVLIYLRQEGRGIGLLNKIKAYQLQDEGMDTVDANIELGFKPDLRQYYPAAQILKSLNLNKVKLMTNNLEKVHGIEKYGIKVTRLQHEIESNKNNEFYLKTKKVRMNHLLNL